MARTTIRAVLACFAFACSIAASAQLMEKAQGLLPVAAKAREAILNHPTLAPFEIEAMIGDALTEAAMVPEGPELYARKRAALAAALEPKLGDIREIASIKMHFLLGAVAAEQGNKDDELYHGAYAAALLMTLMKSGDGDSPATALRIALIDDEYSFFKFMGIRVQPQQRVAREIEGRSYDVWTLKTKSGEAKIYFDFTAMSVAGERVLSARVKK